MEGVKALLAIRHVSFEDLGSLEQPLAAAGYSIRYVDAATADFTRLGQMDWDLLVVLGGPIGVHERDDFPFLNDERRFLEARVKHGGPTLGICLGSQLMADVLGAHVYHGRTVEIGWQSLTLTNAGQLSPLQYFDKPVFHWHGESFDLPAGARHLASTADCMHQAFSWGGMCLALQFHPEVTARGLEQWYVGQGAALRSHGISPAKLRQDALQFCPALARQSAAFLSDWLDNL